MKKQVFAVLLLLLVTACSSDNDDIKTDLNLVGIWERSMVISPEDVGNDLEEGEYFYVNRIEFSSDNSFIEFYYLINGENQEIIGYYSKNEGTYKTRGDRLEFHFNQWISNEEYNQLFVPLENLVLINENQGYSLNYSFQNNQSLLIFNFDPCGPLENCFSGNLEYNKIIPSLNQ